MKACEVRAILEKSNAVAEAKNDLEKFWPLFDQAVIAAAKKGKRVLYLHTDYEKDPCYRISEEARKERELNELAFKGNMQVFDYKYNAIWNKLHQDGFALDRYRSVLKIEW